jgi:hypothetical protein
MISWGDKEVADVVQADGSACPMSLRGMRPSLIANYSLESWCARTHVREVVPLVTTWLATICMFGFGGSFWGFGALSFAIPTKLAMNLNMVRWLTLAKVADLTSAFVAQRVGWKEKDKRGEEGVRLRLLKGGEAPGRTHRQRAR